MDSYVTDENRTKVIAVEAEQEARSIVIKPEGYGDFHSEDGNGTPILLEFWEGQLRLVVWADINSQDPTHVIDLEGAREDKRNDESDK